MKSRERSMIPTAVDGTADAFTLRISYSCWEQTEEDEEDEEEEEDESIVCWLLLLLLLEAAVADAVDWTVAVVQLLPSLPDGWLSSASTAAAAVCATTPLLLLLLLLPLLSAVERKRKKGEKNGWCFCFVTHCETHLRRLAATNIAIIINVVVINIRQRYDFLISSGTVRYGTVHAPPQLNSTLVDSTVVVLRRLCSTLLLSITRRKQQSGTRPAADKQYEQSWWIDRTTTAAAAAAPQPPPE